mgnify:CR=1 FL=1
MKDPPILDINLATLSLFKSYYKTYYQLHSKIEQTTYILNHKYVNTKIMR